MKIDLKKKTYITLAAFSSIHLLLILFVIFPLFQDITKGAKELLSKREKLASLEVKTQKAAVLRKKLQVLKSDLEKIQNLFVDFQMPIEFLQFLEETAKNCDVSVDISLLGKREKELDLRLSLIGTFPNCLKFLDKLESAPYLVKIGDFTARKLEKIEQKEASMQNVKFDFSIEVLTR